MHPTWIAGRLAIARALARLPSAALPLVIAGTYGASGETDAFFLVYAGVLFLSGIFAALENAIVPFVSQLRSDDERHGFTGAVLARVVLVLCPVGVALAVAALTWQVLVPDPAAGWEQAWRHLLILAALPILNGAAAIVTGHLHAGERFLTAAAAAAIRGIVALAIGVAGSGALGLVAYSVGLICGEAAALLWLLAASRLPLAALSLRARATEIRQFTTLSASVLVGALANSSRTFVDRLIASLLGPGAVSLLEYAERLFLMTMSLVGAPYATVMLSRWSRVGEGASPDLAQRLRGAMRGARHVPIALGMLALVGFVALSLAPVGPVLFDRLSGGNGRTLQLVLAMYVIGAVPYLLGLVTSQAILILRDWRFIVTVAPALAIANVPLNVAGILLLGLPGIALASSVLNLAFWLAVERRLRSPAPRRFEIV